MPVVSTKTALFPVKRPHIRTASKSNRSVYCFEDALYWIALPGDVEVIRALFWSFASFLSLSVATGQENARRFDEAPLTQQQQADILHVTGDQSGDDDIPGKPFVEFLGLSTDKTKPPDVVVWRGTGGMGNKDIWIFRRSGAHAALILQNAGGSMYATLHSVHHGMHDFLTFWNVGGGTGGNEVFEFDGNRYQSAYCFDTLSLGTNTEDEKDGPHHPCKHN